ncbi:MAG: phosphate signaling complex protein PhoU [Chloroflexota bacterium]
MKMPKGPNPRAAFDRDLRALQDDLLALGSMVEKAIVTAVEALRDRDLEASRRVVREDDAIDRKRFSLEERVIDMIAIQQPVASDLRTLITALHISVELERIGDYAEGIGKISLMMGDQPPIKPLVDIPRMAEKSVAMLRESLDALVKRDVDLAAQVCNADDEIDQLYDQVYRELLLIMLGDPQKIERATFLLWAAHDLERIGDRATNIAEQVIYLVTGKKTELKVGKY